ncbi:MAG: hypothetical protein LQ350_002216 [Teloschistes chrysophthalmus]|nr:MAG: hypothetical protein LQ350_002216 [Niorma chrysophthalma]
MTTPVANKYPEDASSERQLIELNAALETLIQIFPNVLPEVFREILLRFDGDSRVEVAVNQLVKYEHLWVKGRWRPQIGSITAKDTVDVTKLSKKDSFRCNSYKVAVKAALLQEFKSLSKSAIKAVLAEQNHSYTSARPILQGIASRNWRHSINKFFSRWSRRTDDEAEKHPFIRWTTSANGARIPTLRKSGDDELDHELDQFILTPLSARCKAQQEAKDWDIALRTNQDEARNANAFFECECCFSETTFEQITTCSSSSTHILCFRCVLRAASEALYGQNWKRGIHHDQGLLRCIAPTGNDSFEGCEGCVPQDATQRAIVQSSGGSHIWLRFQSRLAEEALAKARVPLLRCPSCSYAEVTDLYLLPGTLRHRLKTDHPLHTLSFLALALCTFPFLSVYLLLSSFVFEFGTTPTTATVIKQSLTHLTQTSQYPTRFQCRAPACSTLTCTTCFKPWRDPHTCCDSAAVELRTTVEAARTEALKRTCPKCGLSFIKDSGCNKLTCVCGYTMCYVCRQGLGLEEGGEGYSHFCQHFRYAGGGGCGECERCDLYKDENEDEVVKAAGLEAERRWRKKQASKRRPQEGGDAEKNEEGNEDDSVEMMGDDGGNWSVQGLVDWLIRNILTTSVRV